jgi:hypothetical protein
MRQVGSYKEVALENHASGELLREACAFNEMLQAAFPYGKLIAVRKGVYRFKSQQEANNHQDQIVTDTMVAIHAMKRLAA